MTHKNTIAAILIVLIVGGTVFWIASHWDTYAGVLVGLWPLLVGSLVALASLLEVNWWLRFDAGIISSARRSAPSSGRRPAPAIRYERRYGRYLIRITGQAGSHRRGSLSGARASGGTGPV